MTSANVTHYFVKDKNSNTIAHYRQNWLCKNTIEQNLSKHTPHQNFTLYCHHPDENEVIHISTEMDLKDYMR
jgi:hypothetical protein